MLTIGQLAESAGVTIKAVRHYHARGLEEPPRDSSGYRRYSVEHAILLIKIKTLAEAGVLLARIKELLAADSDRFAAALAEIDHKLQEHETYFGALCAIPMATTWRGLPRAQLIFGGFGCRFAVGPFDAQV